MKVKVRIPAKAGRPAEDFEVELEGATLAELREKLAESRGAFFAREAPLLAFVNDKSASKDWSRVELNDKDEVVFVSPVGGG